MSYNHSAFEDLDLIELPEEKDLEPYLEFGEDLLP